MKVDVGMYCYNKTNRKLGIGKIISFEKNNNVLISYKNDTQLLSIGNIVASFDIIDLLKVGDIIIYKHPALETEYTERIYNEKMLEIRKSFFEEKSLELLKIITREQIERVSYKVGEEKWNYG